MTGDYTLDVLGICVDCRRAIRPGEHGTYREVAGWEKTNTKSITERRYTGRVRCAACFGEPGLDMERLFEGGW